VTNCLEQTVREAFLHQPHRVDDMLGFLDTEGNPGYKLVHQEKMASLG